MSASATSTKRPLTQLNHEIEELEAEALRLGAERTAITKQAGQIARRLRYLRLAQTIRRPRASLEFWPIAALLASSVAAGVLFSWLLHVLFGGFALAIVGLFAGMLAGAVVTGALLFWPPDGLVPAAIADAENQSRLVNPRLREKQERLAETNARLKKLIDERRDQIASGKLQRAALLQRPWKRMGDAEWEDFVVEVLRTHGAAVDRDARLGEQDANLVVDFGTYRVALLTQGDGPNVSSAAIQHAIAAGERHRCDRCAVIINRRFTGAAQDFAQRNGCTAIGANEFPDFVLGKIQL
jgi:hypothetical protein